MTMAPKPPMSMPARLMPCRRPDGSSVRNGHSGSDRAGLGGAERASDQAQTVVGSVPAQLGVLRTRTPSAGSTAGGDGVDGEVVGLIGAVVFVDDVAVGDQLRPV